MFSSQCGAEICCFTQVICAATLSSYQAALIQVSHHSGLTLPRPVCADNLHSPSHAKPSPALYKQGKGQSKLSAFWVLNPTMFRVLHIGRSVFRTWISGGEMKECPVNAHAVIPRAQLSHAWLWV